MVGDGASRGSSHRSDSASTDELQEAESEVSKERDEVPKAGAEDERAHGGGRYSDGSQGGLAFVDAAENARAHDGARGEVGDERAHGAASAEGDSSELVAGFQGWRDAQRQEEAEDGRVRGAALGKGDCAYFALGEGDGQTPQGAESPLSA